MTLHSHIVISIQAEKVKVDLCTGGKDSIMTFKLAENQLQVLCVCAFYSKCRLLFCTSCTLKQLVLLQSLGSELEVVVCYMEKQLRG